MKKIFSLLLTVTLCVFLMACGNKNKPENNKATNDVSIKEATQTVENDIQMSENTEDIADGNNILVIYFSATGNTKAIAESIADGLHADTYEIVPQEPYTDADLDYNNNNSRSTQEMSNPSARPEISGTIDNFEQYDTVFIGYPIWWGEAPRILDTFVESYDFTGKTVVPFCTSISSGVGSSANRLESLAGSGEWVDGQRFNETESADKVQEWAEQFK